jgi:hypothetical protein
MSVSVSVSINSVLSSVFPFSLVYLYFLNVLRPASFLMRQLPGPNKQDATVSPPPHNNKRVSGKRLNRGKKRRRKKRKEKKFFASPVCSSLFLDSRCGRRWSFDTRNCWWIRDFKGRPGGRRRERESEKGTEQKAGGGIAAVGLQGGKVTFGYC